MNIDEIYDAVRRVMRDLQLPNTDVTIFLHPHPTFPSAGICYPGGPATVPSIDLADNGGGIPVYRTSEGPLAITIQATPEQEVAV